MRPFLWINRGMNIWWCSRIHSPSRLSWELWDRPIKLKRIQMREPSGCSKYDQDIYWPASTWAVCETLFVVVTELLPKNKTKHGPVRKSSRPYPRRGAKPRRAPKPRATARSVASLDFLASATTRTSKCVQKVFRLISFSPSCILFTSLPCRPSTPGKPPIHPTTVLSDHSRTRDITPTYVLPATSQVTGSRFFGSDNKCRVIYYYKTLFYYVSTLISAFLLSFPSLTFPS